MSNRRFTDLMNISDDTDGDNTSDEYQPATPGKRGMMSTSSRSESTMSSASSRRPTRQPKCFSKNAMMARENRLKKKMYIESLEREVAALKAENKKIASLVENQSYLIAELRKEIRYLKSILANSADISRLIRSINESTGMSVGTSLDDSLTVHKQSSPVSKQSVASSSGKTLWEDEDDDVKSRRSSPEQFPDDNLDMFLDDDVLRHPEDLLNETSDILPLGDNDYDMSLPFTIQEEDEEKEPPQDHSKDHNYTIKTEEGLKPHDDDDVGVCLHVSNHRVSLEFCPTCSENAANNWNKIDENRW